MTAFDHEEFSRRGGKASAEKRLKGKTKKQISAEMKRLRELRTASLPDKARRGILETKG